MMSDAAVRKRHFVVSKLIKTARHARQRGSTSIASIELEQNPGKHVTYLGIATGLNLKACQN